MKNIAVLNKEAELPARLEQLRSQNSLDCVDKISDSYSAYICLEEGRLSLRSSREKEKPIFIDFCGGELLHMQKNSVGKKQLLARAIGISKNVNSVWDMTSGFLKDSFFFCCLGLEVKSFERNQYVFSLQEDAVLRAKRDCEQSPVCNIELENMSAEEALKSSGQAPDAIYLDPMFPETSKSALPNKSMHLFQNFLDPNQPEEIVSLIEKALLVARKRVVLKRPLQATTLSTPDIQYKGKAVRYDVYIP